jgi:hypothetical protein
MSDEVRGGAAVAPDVTPDELGGRPPAPEILSGGPQAPLSPDEQQAASQAKVARVIAQQAALDANAPKPPSPEERAAASSGAAKADISTDQAAAALDPPMPPEEAYDSLELMLSVSTAPEPDKGFIEIPRLTKELGKTFFFWVRGLDEDEMAEIDSKAIRETTAEERQRGYARAVADVAKRDRLMIVKASLSPRLDDPRLLQRHKHDPEEVVKAWLSPGERVAVAELVTELTGFREGSTVRAKAVLDAKKS